MILLEHRNKYYNTDQIVQINAKRTASVEVTELIFFGHGLLVLDIAVADFLADLAEVYKTEKAFAIFSIDREKKTAELTVKVRT